MCVYSLMYSRASSSENTLGGAIEVFSSDPEARMFVSCLALVTFTVMSFWRVCSPITWPSYTCSIGEMKKRPRSCSLSIE